MSELTGPSKPKPKPGQPKRPSRSRRPVAKPPEKYKHLHIKKSGFANYYFNQQEQKRTLAGMSRLGDFGGASGAWVLAGKTAAGETYQLTVAGTGVGLSWKQKAYFQELESADPLDEPKGSGGLLYAMHMWRTFLAQREKGFGELYYLGSEPLDGVGDRVDVVISELGNVRCRWYFDRKEARLLGFDSQREEDADECEVRLSGDNQSGGRHWPKTILVRSAGKVLASFGVETVTIRTETAK